MLHNFKVGDKVVVARAVHDHPYACWIPLMDQTIGKEFVISLIDQYNSVKFESFPIEISTNPNYRPDWFFPVECLEPAPVHYIDGVALSTEEFKRRTREPVKLTAAAALEKYNIIIEG